MQAFAIYNSSGKVDRISLKEPDASGKRMLEQYAYNWKPVKIIEEMITMSKELEQKARDDGTIFEFLNGSHSYDGVWYGEKHPDKNGLFWWRSVMLEALQLNQKEVEKKQAQINDRDKEIADMQKIIDHCDEQSNEIASLQERINELEDKLCHKGALIVINDLKRQLKTRTETVNRKVLALKNLKRERQALQERCERLDSARKQDKQDYLRQIKAYRKKVSELEFYACHSPNCKTSKAAKKHELADCTCGLEQAITETKGGEV